MKKVYVTDYEYDSFADAERVFQGSGIELHLTQSKTEDQVIANCKDADGLLITYAPITRKVMENLPNCKVAVRFGIGYDCIDVDAATDLGVCAVNVPSYCEEEVSDHSLALLMACYRKLVQQNSFVKGGVWDYKLSKPILPLRGSVLGLVALGKIALLLAKKVEPLGMKVLGYDPFVDPKIAEEAGIQLVDDLAEMASQVDYLSVHAPLSKATRNLVSADVLNRMKPTAYVINTARGPVIDEAALIKCLQDGKIAGAGLDVVEKEPINDDNPLLKLDNVILTPHIAWYSTASIGQLQTFASQEVVRVLEGGLPNSLLNPAVVDKLRK